MARWVRFSYEDLDPTTVPDVCVKSGVPAETRVKQSVYQTPLPLFLFLFLGLLPFVFARLAFSRRLDLQLPATRKVAQKKRRFAWTIGLLLAAGLLLLTVGTIWPGDGGLAVWAMLLLLTTAIAWMIGRRRVWLFARDHKDGVQLKGIHPEFVAAVETTRNARPAEFVGSRPVPQVTGWAAALAILLPLLGLLSLFIPEGDVQLERYAAGESGVRFRDSDNTFEVLFPVAPEKTRTTEDAGDFNIEVAEYVAVSGNSGFTAALMQLPSDVEFTDPDSFLQGQAESAARENQGNLLHSRIIDVQGHKAIEFLVDGEAGFIAGRVVVLTSRAVLIQVLGPDNPPTGAARFIRSLQIIQP